MKLTWRILFIVGVLMQIFGWAFYVSAALIHLTDQDATVSLTVGPVILVFGLMLWLTASVMLARNVISLITENKEKVESK